MAALAGVAVQIERRRWHSWPRSWPKQVCQVRPGRQVGYPGRPVPHRSREDGELSGYMTDSFRYGDRSVQPAHRVAGERARLRVGQAAPARDRGAV